MGEIADYYIDRQLHRHMHPEKELNRLRKKRQYQMESFSDHELLIVAEEAITIKAVNEKFLEITQNILNKKKLPLTVKQRNCIYGLLGNDIDWLLDHLRGEKQEKQAKMESLNDQELLQVAEKAITDNQVNEKFLDTANKIIASKHSRLSEKQRNCFYGLLGS